ncbi:MAG: diaminopimelate epimerase [Rhodospirillaceae bacterium]
MDALAFTKMHGLGNDFVVLDARARDLVIGREQARAIADRRTGVGCDQLLIVKLANGSSADAFMEIRNCDGDEVGACGNGTRCIAAMLMDENGTDSAVVQTVAGLLSARRDAAGQVTVDMGPARLDWAEIPLAKACDTLHVGAASGPLADAVCVNMGNPHAVYFVDDAEAIDLETHGPMLEHHPMFPERANIEVLSPLGPDRFRMRVWERSAGITRACGSGACAAAVAVHRRGLGGRKVELVLDGGPLQLEWRDDGHVLMTGPVATAYRGVLEPGLLGG